MRPNSPYFYLGLLATALLGGCVVSSNTETINPHYEERTRIYYWGDSGATSALWGKPEHSIFWREIWPSLPTCNSGEPRIELGSDLLFVGWDKNDHDRGHRVILITFEAAPAIDLSPEIISAAVKARLIRENWKNGFDFEFDGLKRYKDGFVAVIKPAYGPDYWGTLEINLPIPPELLKRPAEPAKSSEDK